MHPSLLPDVGVDGEELLEQYAEVPADFRARVTVFGVQRSLSMLDLRLCFDDLGMWGFGVGVYYAGMDRRFTSIWSMTPPAYLPSMD